MANFPGSLDTGSSLPNPGANSATNNPDHAALHTSENAAIIALETKLGTGSSTPSSGLVLRGTGAGTSAYGQLVLSTDVASFSSANLSSLLTDETGTGLVVFNNSPSLINPSLTTPTIVSFTNAQHNHSNAAGGGKIGSNAITSIDYSVVPISNPYKFSVYLSSNQTVTASTNTKIHFDTKLFDTNSNYDNVTNFRYVAPTSGFYVFIANALNNGNGILNIIYYKNGSQLALGNDLNPATNLSGVVGMQFVQLLTGDYIEVYVNSANTTILGNVNPIYTYFQGFLFCQT